MKNRCNIRSWNTLLLCVLLSVACEWNFAPPDESHLAPVRESLRTCASLSRQIGEVLSVELAPRETTHWSEASGTEDRDFVVVAQGVRQRLLVWAFIRRRGAGSWSVIDLGPLKWDREVKDVLQKCLPVSTETPRNQE